MATLGIDATKYPRLALFLWPFAQADTRAATVLIDELHARILKCTPDYVQGCASRLTLCPFPVDARSRGQHRPPSRDPADFEPRSPRAALH